MIKNILVPIDFSSCSLHALAIAKDFAQKSLATIHLLHIIKNNNQTDEKVLENKLRELIENDSIFLPFFITIKKGNVISEILEYEKHNSIQLIVMGAYGSTGYKALDLGSTSVMVTRQAKSPVMTIKSPVLEKKKNDFEKKNELLTRINTIIREKNKQIQQKQEEIASSIYYTKRLQNAILPSNFIIKKSFKNFFIVNIPKHIVSGDFYWLEKQNGTIYFAVADSTGHGIPGALVSVVCFNALNRALYEYKKQSPAKLLDKTREIVINTFTKSGTTIRDGMDISLISIKGNKLVYAGANNPLWIIRNNTILEFKPNRFPIGYQEKLRLFEEKETTIQNGDVIYLFTDGFVDQFGGPKGKKYKYKLFKEFLLSISHLSMKEQKKLIQKEFEDWKGELEQIDDVCIFATRITL